MTVLFLGAPVIIVLSLSVLMAGALRFGAHIAVRTADITADPQHAAFARGIPPLAQQVLRARQRYRDYQSRTSMFFPLPLQEGVVT
jgi:steroid 5-alpha reductase family enzyme